jgi:hypothetical protein
MILPFDAKPSFIGRGRRESKRNDPCSDLLRHGVSVHHIAVTCFVLFFCMAWLQSTQVTSP